MKCLFLMGFQSPAETPRVPSAMKRIKLSLWLALLLLVEPAPARPDLIFKVPEVLVRHAAVPRPVGTGPTLNTSRGNDTSANELLQQATAYYMEHEISTADARKAAQMMKLFQVPDTLPGCGACSRWEIEYCESDVLGDHCCCERRYMREPFPWLPHSCFLGSARCEPHADNCAHYTRIRDCCCNKKLAEKWKGILSKASQLSLSGMALLVFALILFSIYL